MKYKKETFWNAELCRYEEVLTFPYPTEIELLGIFPDDTGKSDIVQEFFGLCLTKEQKYDKALFLIGGKANRKSTILHILQRILGERNYSSVPLKLFNNPHHTANFYNRLANISMKIE